MADWNCGHCRGWVDCLARWSILQVVVGDFLSNGISKAVSVEVMPALTPQISVIAQAQEKAFNSNYQMDSAVPYLTIGRRARAEKQRRHCFQDRFQI